MRAAAIRRIAKEIRDDTDGDVLMRIAADVEAETECLAAERRGIGS